jgi:NAD(P)-dependent dehydrogenase (short-subunit alcohol dehydrogenase family)
MDLGLSGKTVIVTGAASNIGRTIALTFAKEGSAVVIADIDEVQANKVAREIAGMGRKSMVVRTDITDMASVRNLVEKARAAYGGRIDVLVNNAGWAKPVLFHQTEPDLWKKTIDINYVGMLNCTRAVLPHMIERKQGAIVSIASDAARVGEYLQAVYAGAKAGIVAASKTIAQEVGKYGVRLNVVCPGMTPPANDEVIGEMSLWRKGTGGPGDLITPEMQERAKKVYPLRRLGRPEDVANAVAFLASDCTSFITGQVLSVSGGFSMV